MAEAFRYCRKLNFPWNCAYVPSVFSVFVFTWLWPWASSSSQDGKGVSESHFDFSLAAFPQTQRSAALYRLCWEKQDIVMQGICLATSFSVIQPLNWKIKALRCFQCILKTVLNLTQTCSIKSRFQGDFWLCPVMMIIEFLTSSIFSWEGNEYFPFYLLCTILTFLNTS